MTATATLAAPAAANLRTALWRHQQAAYDFAVDKPATLLAMGLGTGKSLTTIALLDAWDAQRTLILCPKSVAAAWPGQFRQHLEAAPTVAVLTEGHTPPGFDTVAKRVVLAQRMWEQTPGPLVIVLNYEAAIQPAMARWLQQQRWDAVVADEAHKLKSNRTATSKVVHRIGRRARHRLALTGTPMPHALPLDCPVLTPTGWRPMGSLSIGDAVIGSNGEPTRVVGVWPQGRQTVFSVAFSDGAVVACTTDHLWQVTTRSRTARGLSPLVLRTDELKAPRQAGADSGLLDRGGAPRWSIPIMQPAQFEAQPVPLDPYVLGVLLGNGHLGHPLSFCTPDREVADEVAKRLPIGVQVAEHAGSSRGAAVDYRITTGKRGGSPGRHGPTQNPAVDALDALGLRGHRSPEKFIPDCYLWNSVGNRLALLQGLCDTDGSACGSTTRYTTTSPRLAEGVASLVRSLGGLVRTTRNERGEVRLPQGGTTVGLPIYTLTFRLPFVPFLLERKRARNGPLTRQPRRGIVSIEAGGTTETQCITVDAADGLFVTKDFAVTHNSPLDLFGLYRFLDDRVYGLSWLAFRNTYAITNPAIPQMVVGHRNLDTLMAKMATIAYQVDRDVLDLPPAHHITRTCRLGAEGRRIYREMERDFTATLQAHADDPITTTASTVLVKVLRLMQLASGQFRDDQGQDHTVDTAKRDALAEVLDELPRNEPVVVFCKFRADLDTVKAVTEGLGRGYRELSGRVNELADWQAGGGTVIGVQIQAGGAGITLVRAAYCVYLSTGYSLGDYLQSEARCHRPGQDRPVTYVHIETEGTIDQKVSTSLRERRDVMESLLETIRR